MVKESNAKVVYVKVKGVSDLTYTEMLAYNMGSLLNTIASLRSVAFKEEVKSGGLEETMIYGLVVILCLIIAIEAYIIYSYSRKIEKLRRRIREIEGKSRGRRE